jgi:Skp family chaperone for outer membrane proteins
MKTFRLIAAAFFIAAIFSASAFAQAANKIGLINTAAFEDEKAGITKFINGRKSLNLEFKTELDALGVLYTRIGNLEKEIVALETQIKAAQANPQVPISPTLQTSYSTKADEYGKLGREYKFKQDDLKVRYERREQVLLGPILLDIGKAIQDYQKQKAYAVLFDATKLFQAGVLLAWDDVTDVTVDFIKFYNTRPAAAVTPVKVGTTNTTSTTTVPATVPVKKP